MNKVIKLKDYELNRIVNDLKAGRDFKVTINNRLVTIPRCNFLGIYKHATKKDTYQVSWVDTFDCEAARLGL